MCQFCVEHGEGERWYLNARNYAFHLESDLKRRDYVIRFAAGFPQMRENALSWMGRLDRLPAPLSKAGKNAISIHMRKHHFGQPLPIEDCERVLRLATSITVIPCICRMHEPGKRAEEVCILVTTQPMEAVLAEGFRDYADGPDLDDFHRMSADAALTLLRECEYNGLMHSIWTFETPFTAAICNCNLESGCMAMKLARGHELKTMWRGEYVARLDEERCSACGACVRVCPFDAISSDGRRVRVSARDCWGCGICRSSCRKDALELVDRREVPEVSNVW